MNTQYHKQRNSHSNLHLYYFESSPKPNRHTNSGQSLNNSPENRLRVQQGHLSKPLPNWKSPHEVQTPYRQLAQPLKTHKKHTLRYNSVGENKVLQLSHTMNNGEMFKKYNQEKFYRHGMKVHYEYNENEEQLDHIETYTKQNSKDQGSRNSAYMKKIPMKTGLKLSMKNIGDGPERPKGNRIDLSDAVLTESIKSSGLRQIASQSELKKLMKHIEALLECQKQKLKTKLQEQSTTIRKLQQKIQTMEIQVSHKQSQIKKLKNSLKVPESIITQVSKLQNNAHKLIKEISVKLQNQQIQLNQHIKQIGDRVQALFSQKSQHISHFSDLVAQLKQQIAIRNNQNLSIFQKFLQKIQKQVSSILAPKASHQIKTDHHHDHHGYHQSDNPGHHRDHHQDLQYLKFSFSTGSQSSQIHQIAQKSSDILSETAKFNASQSDKQDNEFQNSSSYFFHPSELHNLDKIRQLFKFRDNKPIKCSIDEQNRLKYSESGTFMFDRRGNPLKLNDNQLRYYVDCGFIKLAQILPIE